VEIEKLACFEDITIFKNVQVIQLQKWILIIYYLLEV